DVLADDAGKVGEAVAAPHADVLVAEEDRAAAELGDRGFEADPGPQRRLFEDQAQRAPRQIKGTPAPLLVALECGRVVEEFARAGRRQLEQVDKMMDHRGTLLRDRIESAQATAWRSTSARIAQPSSISSSLMVSAGRSRMTWPCVALIRSLRSRQAETIAVASTVSSRPIITPETRITRISSGSSLRRASNCCRNRRPIAWPRSSNPSCSMVSMVARPARQAIGLPPKVLACIPGWRVQAISRVAIITPAAIPPARALAQV